MGREENGCIRGNVAPCVERTCRSGVGLRILGLMDDSDRFPPGFKNTGEFAPGARDSLARLLEKAEGHLDYLRRNEEMLRNVPVGAVDESRALWEPLATLIRAAMENPDVEEDARLEANRVWAEEIRHSALVTVTSCVHYRSQQAIDFFERAGTPERRLEELARWESMRSKSMRVLSKEDLDALRERGFLRPGE